MKEQRELFDDKTIISALSPGNRLHLSHLDIFETIDSTNTYLLTQAKQQLNKRKSGWVCLAEQQTRGRGREDKTWFSPYATNIYCSISWSFPAAFSGLSALSLVSAILLIKALNKLGIVQGLGLKWPNDILCSGRKLAGILLENLVSAQQNWVVIGLGLNLSLPPEKNKEWIGAEEILGASISRNSTAAALLNEFLLGLPLFEAEGLRPFLSLINAHDLLEQKEIAVQTPSAVVLGLAQGISERGELIILDQEGRQQKFSYGEVSVRLK